MKVGAGLADLRLAKEEQSARVDPQWEHDSDSSLRLREWLVECDRSMIRSSTLLNEVSAIARVCRVVGELASRTVRNSNREPVQRDEKIDSRRINDIIEHTIHFGPLFRLFWKVEVTEIIDVVST
jgi:hypothetical protein